MNFTVISDTHGLHAKIPVPHADILIHAGDNDLSTLRALRDFLVWLASQPHRYKILIAGNHDWVFERQPQEAQNLCASHEIIYLEDSGVEVNGLKFWGSPYTPQFFNWAFMKDRGLPMEEHWTRIPEDSDILITHGPPHGILDQNSRGMHVGCEALADRIHKLSLQYHLFGHIHESRGSLISQVSPQATMGQKTTFINACSLDGNYTPWPTPPTLWEIAEKKAV